MTKRPLLASLLAASLLAPAAHAGGMFLPFRGVRPAGRGGAFVAGADDVGALWYNPAGLAMLAGGGEKHQLLFDASYVGHSVSYTRIDSGGNPQPTVTNDPQIAPIPTLGAEFDLHDNLAIGVGLLAPNASLDGYPETGPQRYALVNLHSTVIAVAEAAVGWRVNDKLRVGAGVQDWVTNFQSRVVFSACPGQTVCAPEDPDFDSLGEISGLTLFAPSLIAGVQYQPTPAVTLGATFQFPVGVGTDGSVRVRLPRSGFFNGASVQGDEAHLSLDFPAALRVGVQLAPSPRFRLELGADWEMWSQQARITVTPKNVRVVNAAGVGTYDLGPIVVPRNLDDTFAVRVGLETQPFAQLPIVLRAGYVYETGATSEAYLSVLTVDTPKHVGTVGLGYQGKKVRVDLTYAHVINQDADVAAGVSCVPLVNPIRSGQPGAVDPSQCIHDGDPDHVYVGDGSYRSSWDVLGLGVTVDF